MKFYTIFKFFIGRIIFFILSNNKKNKELKIKRNNLKWNIVLNDAIGLSLYLFGSFEKKNISCFSKFLKKNTVAIDIGAKVVWLQLGVVNQEVADKVLSAGLTMVQDRCMKIEHARLFGGLNLIGVDTGIISAHRPPTIST